jgi:hypothetical protein
MRVILVTFLVEKKKKEKKESLRSINVTVFLHNQLAATAHIVGFGLSYHCV